ncbi:hypothetical protein H1W37_02505 [Stappia taiwanensis]|uniref:Uncharacterized protein n=1 Tax=Stappia taiwanensis TaxID=992267 RepID=A0A838XK75_9HYPH|nr:hypothetical protein [Stappia taiwanensis]MBA4610512.1 hypothetical protein [Stappia taiwanensis]
MATRIDRTVRPFLFALVWTLIIAGLAAALTLGREEALSGRSLAVIAVYATGSFTGGLISWGIARLVTLRRPHRSARFAAMLICLTVTTAGFSAFLFYLQLRAYYAAWHAHDFSYRMIWEQLFTGATTAYIFGVMGARRLLPFAIVPLLAASWYFARIEPRRRVC